MSEKKETLRLSDLKKLYIDMDKEIDKARDGMIERKPTLMETMEAPWLDKIKEDK